MNTTTVSKSAFPDSASAESGALVAQIGASGAFVLRYGLVLVIARIGAMKFTPYEADGIQPLVANGPFMSWLYRFLNVQQFSAALGALEILIAAMIAVRPWSVKASAAGSVAAVCMFLTTLSFLFTTPGWEPSLGGFPALSASVGQFLLKDVVLLGAAIWSVGESYSASANRGYSREVPRSEDRQ